MNLRSCLLSQTYTGGPLLFRGREIHFSPVVNEIVREFGSALFTRPGNDEQTEFHGMAEGLLVMDLVQCEDWTAIKTLRSVTPAARRKMVTDFILEHLAEIETIQPEIIARLQHVMASAVVSEGLGKSPPPVPGSSP